MMTVKRYLLMRVRTVRMAEFVKCSGRTAGRGVLVVADYAPAKPRKRRGDP